MRWRPSLARCHRFTCALTAAALAAAALAAPCSTLFVPTAAAWDAFFTTMVQRQVSPASHQQLAASPCWHPRGVGGAQAAGGRPRQALPCEGGEGGC